MVDANLAAVSAASLPVTWTPVEGDGVVEGFDFLLNSLSSMWEREGLPQGQQRRDGVRVDVHVNVVGRRLIHRSLDRPELALEDGRGRRELG